MRAKINIKARPKAIEAFSLVEVVVALAIVVFALFSMVGLLGVGLANSHDSRERMQAATIAEEICSVRRAAPTNDLSNTQPGFPLPVLETQMGNISPPPVPLYLTRDGLLTNQANADFGFLYSITPKLDAVPANTTHGVSQVYMAIFWPANAPATNAATGRYEITTVFGLP
jgi:type II secretory pathway pseudopilin PulG